MHRLVILWHFHQPDYRDPITGRPRMPWTRLHALRGMRDLPIALLRTGAPAVVNLVPVLIEQVEALAGGPPDAHLELTRIPARELDPEQAATVVRTFFHGHPAMRRAHPAYRALEARAREGLGVDELRDLQVWSTLAWVGWSGLEARPELEELRARGRGFTEEDKAVLLEACEALAGEVPELWRRLAADGRVEISASPGTHPILPLIVDTAVAARCLPPPPEPVDFRHPEDALRQLRRGRAAVEAATGAAVRGLWPPEGAVSPEVVELAAEAGFSWMATDEEVLARSEREGGTPRACGPWRLHPRVAGFFRDHGLSDEVGFHAASLPAEEAVASLLAGVSAREGPVVFLALDGENPWEGWPGAGREFQLRLGEALARGRAGVVGATASEVLDGAPRPLPRVRRLHTGSWIGGDLAIWYGHPQDRAAWRLLAEARSAARAAGDPPEALRHLDAAAGSDWFWWYGDEFDSPFRPAFDALFRDHLRAAWRALDRTPPPELDHPVPREAPSPPRWEPPRGPVQPDPLRAPDTAPRWLCGGRLLPGPQGAMGTAERLVRTIRWGRGGERLWLLVELVDGAEPDALTVAIQLAGGTRRSRCFGLREEDDPKAILPRRCPAGLLASLPLRQEEQVAVLEVEVRRARHRERLQAGPSGFDLAPPAPRGGWP